MRYFCTNCNYTYDEGLGDKEEDIAIWTKIDDIKYCPVCEEPHSFHGIEEEVNYLDNEENMSLLELDHIPVIKIKDDSLEVNVWLNPHPMWDEHRITTISIYDEYEDLVFEEFLYPDMEPKANFDISDLDDFEVRVKCSIHWVWGKKIVR